MVTGPITRYDRRQPRRRVSTSATAISGTSATGGRTNERDRWFVRGQLLFEPTDALSIRLIGDYGKIDENCCGVVNAAASAATRRVNALIGGQGQRSRPTRSPTWSTTTSDPTNEIENYGVSGQIDY